MPIKLGPAARVCILLFCVANANAVERYTIAQSAEIVVVGKLQHASCHLQADGWHIRAEVTFSEVLYGVLNTKSNLRYGFVCSCCPTASPPPIRAIEGVVGLWFLISGANGYWASAGDCSDPGYRPIGYRDDMRRFLKTRRP